MIWLGSKRGQLTDYVTQIWVKATGKKINLSSTPWLSGPTGKTNEIGVNFFQEFAADHKLEIRPGTGLIKDFRLIVPNASDAVVRFYEQTSEYELEAWSEWCSFFKPFGQLLALIFSRRLQQLNVPLSALDTSLGVSSSVIDVVDPISQEVLYTGWLRELRGTHNVLYAGSYSSCSVPNFGGVCIKVVFPLPNGNAIVIMYPETHENGAVSVTSAGKGFGGPGFYFTVHHDGHIWAKYVGAMQESILVYESEERQVRADHVLKFWGATFLRLHYRLRRRHTVPDKS